MTAQVSQKRHVFPRGAQISEISGFWPELNCHDVRAAIAFYGRTASWRFQEVRLDDGSSYWLALQGGRPLCGIHPLDPVMHAGIVPHWMNHAVVADLDEALRAAQFRGGKVLRPVYQVPGLGRLAVIVDGCGALLGFMERDETLAMTETTTSVGMTEECLADGHKERTAPTGTFLQAH